MRALMIVAGLAAAVALVSGVLLLRGERAAEAERLEAGGRLGPPASSLLLRETVRERDDARERIEAMERRLDELTSEVEMLREWASLPVADGETSTGLALTVSDSNEDGDDGSHDAAARASDSTGSFESDGGDTSKGAEKARMVASRREAAKAMKEARREADLMGRVERASKAMNLIPAESQRLEEIVRGHLEKVDGLGQRAKKAMKDSGFGLAPADKAVLDQLSRDRRVVDKQLQTDVVALVGPERYKQYQRALRDQRNKEKALKRISRFW